ncbi:MAG: cytochrome c3 family protein [Gemmatimonadota bacterium]
MPRFTSCSGSLFLAILAGATPTSLRAQWPNGLSIQATPHNLTIPAQNTDKDMIERIANYGEICVYCHSPHGTTLQGEQLWNRPTPSGPYRMYDGGTAMPMDAQPTGNSLRCLSCHDGTIGLDGVIDSPNSFQGIRWGESIERCDNCHSGGNPPGGIDWEGVWFDTDLRKQHPISILYDPLATPGFRTAVEVEAAGLRLFSGKVQCMTCHEPHSQQFRPFLRISNANRQLCLVCHTSNPSESTAHFW